MAKHIYSRLLFGLIAGALCAGLAGCGGGTHSDHAHASGDPAPPYTIDAGSTIYDFKAKNIDGWPTPLSRYEGKVLLVVNVASECRFTHQYDNLQRLYMKYKDRGLVVLGFPTNDFGRQEPGTDAEIKEFTSFQYNIMFPMFSKISVTGERMHPVYQCLTGPETGGAFAGPITWNFNKFLIDRNGKTIARFDSETDPLDPEITEAIEAAL
ncbi:MAG: glutathione peroxidase [Planctomycetota bacterium]